MSTMTMVKISERILLKAEATSSSVFKKASSGVLELLAAVSMMATVGTFVWKLMELLALIVQLSFQALKDMGLGLAEGIVGMWGGVQLVGMEFSSGCQEIYRVSTLRNMAQLITWGVFLVVFPTVAHILYDLLTKNIPKYLFDIGKGNLVGTGNDLKEGTENGEGDSGSLAKKIYRNCKADNQDVRHSS